MKLSLRHYLALAFTMIATVPVLILGLWVEDSSMDKEMAAVSEKHLLLATNTTAALDRYATDAKAVFELFTDPQEMAPTPSRIALAEKIGFRHISTYDSSGALTAQLVVDGTIQPILAASQLVKLRTYLSDESPTFSDVMLDSQNRPTLYLVKSLASGGGLAIGALNLDYIRQMQSAISFGRKGHSAIVDRRGNILAHPLEEWQIQIKNISAVKPVELMMKQKSGVTTFYSPAINSDMITGYSTVPATGWGVMVPQPMDELEERAGEVKQIALGLIAIGLVVAALLSWVMAGLLIRPLESIIAASRKFARGSLDVHVQALPGGYPHEYRELGNTFNTMIRDIAKGILEREDASSDIRITAEQLDRMNNRLKSHNESLEHEVNEAVQKNQAFIQSVVDAVPGVINAKDLNSRYLFMNKFQADLYGTTPDQAIGKTAGELLPGEFATRARRMDQEVIGTGKALPPFEETYPAADGHTYTWLTTKTPLKDDAGDVCCIVTSAIDITQLRQLADTKNRFISTVSNDLHAPVTIAHDSLGLLDLLYTDKLPEEVNGIIEIARKNTDRLTSLADDILDVQLLETGQMPFNFEPLDLKELINEALILCRDIAETQEIAFELIAFDHKVMVRADRTRMIQVLTNLLSNAVHFSPKGQFVEICVDWDDLIVTVLISDKGAGVSEETKQTVLESFARTDNSDTRVSARTGLGLTLSKLIVEKHGGEIGYTSVAGEGSQFYFTFAAGQRHLKTFSGPALIKCRRLLAHIVQNVPALKPPI